MALIDLSFTPYSSVRERLHLHVLNEEWNATRRIFLTENIDDKTKAWVLLEVCKWASEDDIKSRFGPYIFTGEALHNGFESILARTMSFIYYFDLTESMHRQYQDNVFSYFNDRHTCIKLTNEFLGLTRPTIMGLVYPVLRSWIIQGQWGALRLALNFLPTSAHTWFCWQVLELADEFNLLKFMSGIINMTTGASQPTTVTYVLEKLMKRNMWCYVGKVLAMNIKLKTRKRCCSIAIQLACKRAGDVDLLRYILPVCPKHLAERVISILTDRELWSSLHGMLHRFEISPTLKAQAVERAASRAPDNVCEDFLVFCPESLLQFVLKKALERRLELTAARLLQHVVHNLLANRCIKQSYKALEEMFKLCQNPSVLLLFKNGSLKTMEQAVIDLQKVLAWKGPLCELLLLCLLQVLGGKGDRVCTNKGMELFFCHAADFFHVVTTLSLTAAKKPKALAERMKAHFHSTSQEVPDLITFVNIEGFDCFSAFVAIKYFVKVYGRCRKDGRTDDALLTVLAMFPIVPLVQNVAIRLMLRQKRWNVIRQASLTHIWEHVRRELFQAAVEQGQWSLVKQWADHTLYDDQRWWAVNVAYEQRQWDVMFPLAEFGLTVSEVMSVHYRLALHADWKTARKLLERGCEVSELKELVMNVHNTRRKDKPSRAAQSERYATLVKQDESWKSQMKTKSFSVAVRRKKWSLVLHWLRKIPHSRRLAYALTEAIGQEVWHIVIQLVRLGIPQSEQEGLFKQMMEMKQWAVCRVLMETSHFVAEFLLPHLSDLVARSQWILVSRVIDQGVDDKVLENILRTAMDRREGSLVWHCLARMGNKVTKEQRQELLQRAWCREMWQAVRCLLEFQPEISNSMLQSSVDHEQWDLIDHCETHGADINIKDGNGETYLHRAARQRHWRAVRELVSRDADPNMADSDGLFPLHRACQADEWSTVDLLIQYLADLSAVDRYERTPLMMIIDSRQGKIIEQALMWSDKLLGKNRIGETVLHAVCRCGMPEIMYYLIRRGVDPFAVTNKGQTIMMYAAEESERMVTECIKLGLSTYQANVSLTESFKDVFRNSPKPITMRFGDLHSSTASPFEYAVTRRKQEVRDMLFESGAVSNKELHKLCDVLEKRVVSPKHVIFFPLNEHYIYYAHGDTAVLSYLKDKSTTPRSLVSCCRLVISHSLGFCCRREQNARCLNLPERLTKYVLFQNITDNIDATKANVTGQYTAKHDYEHMSCALGPYFDMDELLYKNNSLSNAYSTSEEDKSWTEFLCSDDENNSVNDDDDDDDDYKDYCDDDYVDKSMKVYMERRGKRMQ